MIDDVGIRSDGGSKPVNILILGLALVAVPPPAAPVAPEPAAVEPTVTCCTLDGFCQELNELECEEVSLVSLAQDIEPEPAPAPSPVIIDGDMAYAVLANPDAFEARVNSCSEPFLRSVEQGFAFNCLLDLDGELLSVLWPDFDRRPERGTEGFSSPHVGATYFVRFDERHDDFVVFAALEVAP